MTAESIPTSESTAVVAHEPVSFPVESKWKRGAWFGFKSLVGMLLGQTLVGSVWLLGWTVRVMQRVTLWRWWRLGASGRDAERGGSFAEFAAGGMHAREHVYWPNWVLGQKGCAKTLDAESSWLARFGAWTGFRFHSLRKNLRLGVQAILTTWTLTLPGCVLWAFAWYDGWNNSFNKGYEQAAVGPLVFILGMALFIAAMFYVPMAQARFASTGNWRSFFEFRFVWSLVRQEWLGCVILAGLYAAFSFPVTILKTMPQFFPQMQPAFEQMTLVEAQSFLKTYFFWCMLLFLPAFVLLRMAAAHLYAGGIVRGLRRGTVTEEALAENEWESLHRLDLLRAGEVKQHHVIVALLGWMATRAGRLTAGVLIAVFWFLFVAQILVGEFFNYHPGVGWLNQPLVQLPWFRYLPAAGTIPAS